MSTPAADRLRVAIVGAGYVATHHLAALARLEYVELVGICDPHLEAAQALAHRHGIPLVTRTLAELAPAQPQAVHILTPPATHASLAIQAMDMGCHVLVEKPMADSVAECQAMLDKARQTGRLLGVNHSDLFDPMILQALQAVRAGRIGTVLSVDIIRNSDYPPYAGGPLPALVTQGSYPFRDLGVHGLYTLEAFLGPIHQLQVNYQSRGEDPNLHFDQWQAQAQAGHGVGRMLLSWTARPMENRLIVRGTHGTLEVDRFVQTCHLHRPTPGPKFVGILVHAFLRAAQDLLRIPCNVLRFATGLLKPSPGIRHGAQAFADAVRDNAAPPFSGEDALRLARLLEPACQAPDQTRRDMLQARLAPLPPADVLVTGGGGFLGRRLVAALRSRNVRVRVLLRRPLAAYRDDPGIHMVIGDLGDPCIVDHAVAGTRQVYHLGAAMRGGPRDFQAGTIWGTTNIVNACLRHRTTRLIYVSSMSVLDHAGRTDKDIVSESYRFEPHPQRRGAYTQTKLQAEDIVVTATREQGLPAVILRPGQIFGPGAEHTPPNGVIALAGCWLAIGARHQTLPLIYVDDVVDALLLAADTPAIEGRLYHIADTHLITQHEYLSRVRHALGPRPRILRVPVGLFMALGLGVEALGKLLRRDLPLSRYRIRSLRPLAHLDTHAAQQDLGWTPRIGTPRGMDLTFGPIPPPAAAPPDRSSSSLPGNPP